MRIWSHNEEKNKIYSQREGVFSYQPIISGRGQQMGSKLQFINLTNPKPSLGQDFVPLRAKVLK